jgi:hypothetical protein
MSRMLNYGMILVLVAVAVLELGCARGISVPGSSIKGLTLPPGAIIMPLSDVAQQMQKEQTGAEGDAGNTAAAQMTGFNYDGNLDAVAVYLESILKPQGWKRLKPVYIQGRMGGVIQKVYYAGDKTMELQITDWAIQNAQNNDIEGKARFVLTEIRGTLINPATGEKFPDEGGNEALEDL